MSFDITQVDFSFIATHKEVAMTLIWIMMALAFRSFVRRAMRNAQTMELDKKRQRLNTFDNLFNMVLVIGLVVIWLAELQNLAFSIAAFMVALVLATKEFIQCIVGAFFKASTRPFRVGDWIRIGDFEGDVTDSDWLTTTLFEVDINGGTYGYTGRTSVIPNSLLVTHTLQNLNYMRRYVTHSFSIVRNGDQVNLFGIKDQILTNLQEYSEHFSDVAKRYNSLIEKRLDIKISGPEPSVRITTTMEGYNVFTVSIFCPTQEAADIEQKVMEDFMRLWHEHETASK